MNGHIRWMIRRDIEDVIAIDDRSFAEPWVEKDFLLSLRERNVIGMIIELGEKIVGYMVYNLHKKCLHLDRLAIEPEYRNLGYGSQLITKLHSKLEQHRRNRIVFEVPDHLLEAHLWLRRRGFSAVRVIRGEPDLYRFALRLEAHKPITVE